MAETRDGVYNGQTNGNPGEAPNAVAQAATATNPGVQVQGTIPNAPNGGGGLDTKIVEAEVPGLLTTAFDKNVVKMGYTTAVINAISRSRGFKMTKSMEFGYWSRGLRERIVKIKQTGASAGSAIDLSEVDFSNPLQPDLVEIPVDNANLCDVTDQVMILGVDGAVTTASGETISVGDEIEGMPLNGRISEVKKSAKTIVVQFFNLKSNMVIPDGAEILILGHALANSDAQVTPRSAVPTPRVQYMQKFMDMALVENVFLESQKEANWGLRDIVEMNTQSFIEDIEYTYIFGIRSKTTDPTTTLLTYTMAGAIQQILEGGGHYIRIPKSTLSHKTIRAAIAEIFLGNTGSAERLMLTGTEFALAILDLDDDKRYKDTDETVSRFEYDWNRWKLFAWSLLRRPHPLFDQAKRSNWAMVLDEKYVERHVFRTVAEDQKDLMDMQLLDAKNVRRCEISSLLIKYPQCHGLIVIVDDSASNSASGSDANQGGSNVTPGGTEETPSNP